MVAEIVWRPLALRQLQQLADYIGAENPRAATAYIDTILTACERLTDFPRSGRMFDDAYRLLVVRNHLVVYRDDADQSKVIIITVLDGRRDIAKFLENLEHHRSDY